MKKINRNSGNMKITFTDEYGRVLYEVNGVVKDRPERRKKETYKSIVGDMKVKIIKNDQVIYETRDKKRKNKNGKDFKEKKIKNTNEQQQNTNNVFDNNKEAVETKDTQIIDTLVDNTVVEEKQEIMESIEVVDNQIENVEEIQEQVIDNQSGDDEIVVVAEITDKEGEPINLDDILVVDVEKEFKEQETDDKTEDENIENKAKELHEKTKEEIEKIIVDPRHILRTKRKYLNSKDIVELGKKMDKMKENPLPSDVLDIIKDAGIDIQPPTSYDKYEQMAVDYGYDDDYENHQKIKKTK